MRVIILQALLMDFSFGPFERSRVLFHFEIKASMALMSVSTLVKLAP
jgi:hypothetical protein